jgi:hypothetical protein
MEGSAFDGFDFPATVARQLALWKGQYFAIIVTHGRK